MEYIFVALGGALGASARFGLSNAPFLVGFEFPYSTLMINVLGSFVIGVIAGIATRSNALSRNTVLFLKVGVCGGFTTFSTFSLEVFELFSQQKYVSACAYIGASVIGCVIGVALGDLLSRTFVGE